MITVYIEMVADLFHVGHVNILRNASMLGDLLVVGIHSDEDVASYKRLPILTLEERIGVVEGCKWVDIIIPAAPLNPSLDWFKKHNIDKVAIATTAPEFVDKFYSIPRDEGMLVILPRTQGISSTDIIDRVKRA